MVAASGVAPPQSARPRLQPPYALSAPNVQNGALLVAQKWTLYPRDDTEQGFLVQSVEGEHPCFLENYDKCPFCPFRTRSTEGLGAGPRKKMRAEPLARPRNALVTDEGSDSFDLLAPLYSKMRGALRRRRIARPAVPPMRRAQHGGPFAARQRSAHG